MSAWLVGGLGLGRSEGELSPEMSSLPLMTSPRYYPRDSAQLGRAVSTPAYDIYNTHICIQARGALNKSSVNVALPLLFSAKACALHTSPQPGSQGASSPGRRSPSTTSPT